MAPPPHVLNTLGTASEPHFCLKNLEAKKINPMFHQKAYLGFSIVLSILHILLSLPFAQCSFSFPSTGCVNPSGFDSCWATTSTAITNCWADNCEGAPGETCSDFFGCESTSSRCTNACICVMYAEYINCALSNCWNQVNIRFTFPSSPSKLFVHKNNFNQRTN